MSTYDDNCINDQPNRPPARYVFNAGRCADAYHDFLADLVEDRDDTPTRTGLVCPVLVRDCAVVSTR